VYTRAELEEHKRRLPRSFAPWIASGLACEAQGDAGAAMDEYAAIDDFCPGNVWASLHIGRLLLASGDAQGATLALKRAQAAAPRSRAIADLLEAAGPLRRARVGAGA